MDDTTKQQLERRAKTELTVGSFSKIAQFFRCPWLYYQEYVLHVKMKPNKNMIYGKLIHLVCERLASVRDASEILDLTGFTEDEQHKVMVYLEWFSDKINVVVAEYASTISVDGFEDEFHIDRIVVDMSGNLYMMDLKTSPVVETREDLEDDHQLNMYMWAFIEKVRAMTDEEAEKVLFIDRDELIQIFDDPEKKKFIGHFAWYHERPVLALYDMSKSWRKIFVDVMTELQDTDPDNFPKIVNKYCAGCLDINRCIPDEIPDTYAGLCHRRDQLEAQIELKKARLFEEFGELGTKKLPVPDEHKIYVLKTKPNYAWEMDKFYARVGNNPETLKLFVKPSSGALKNLGVDPKEAGQVLASISPYIDIQDVPQEGGKLPKKKKE